MIRPHMCYGDDSADRLYDSMVDLDYPHIDDHELLLDRAVIFHCMNEDATAGYFWFYQLEDAPAKFVMHALVMPEYQSRFFSRTLLTTVYNSLWTLGVDCIVVEDDCSDLLVRMGGYETNLGAELDLPFKWRR